jgi:hypothetical protein
MKLKLNQSFTNLDGTKNTQEKSMANVLAHALFQRAKILEPIKAHEFALKLHRDEEIEIDTADYEKLIKEIEGYEYPVWVKAQLLGVIKSQKEEVIKPQKTK